MSIQLWSFEEWYSKQNLEPNSDVAVADLLSVNEWSTEDWQKIPGIGPKLAQRLLESSPFDSIENVKEVKGISEKMVEAIKQLL